MSTATTTTLRRNRSAARSAVASGTGIITRRTPCAADATSLPLLLQQPFVAIDLETTGGSADIHRIVEIGAVKMNPDGTVLDTFSVITNPGRVPLPERAERIHGISPGEIRAGQPLEHALADLAAFIGPLRVTAHNLGFENRFLTAAYKRTPLPTPAWEGICTLATAREHLHSPHYNLQYLLDLLQIDAVNDHRAASDAKACGLVLAKLIAIRRLTTLTPLAPPAAPPTPPRRSPVSGTAVFGKLRPTDEQLRALDGFRSGTDLAVAARAGSGKTSTLFALSRVDTARPGIYLAYNKSVAAEAARKFGKQVSVSTAHALAHRHIKTTSYGPLLAKLDASRVPWRQVGAAIGTHLVRIDTIHGVQTFGEYRVTRLAIETVAQYCRTVDTDIDRWHVPYVKGLTTQEQQDLASRVLPLARRVWKQILDPEDRAVPFTPDHYLKLWALTDPIVGEPGGYVLFDEAQDANPVVRSIISAQEHLQRVFVGDEFQAIYGFTGATNSMAKLGDIPQYSLTQSFRFGDAIADAANVWLTRLGATDLVRGNPDRRDRITGPGAAADAVLCRTNADALAEVIAAQAAGKATALIGDAEHARRFCDSAADLQAGLSPKHPELESFSHWGQVQEYVEHDPGVGEWKTLVKLIDDHTVDVVANALANLAPPRTAQLTVVTCHRAKGLEFPRVRINSNWSIDANTDDDTEHRTEQMLAYVSLTRAQTELNPGALLPGYVPPARPPRAPTIPWQDTLF